MSNEGMEGKFGSCRGTSRKLNPYKATSHLLHFSSLLAFHVFIFWCKLKRKFAYIKNEFNKDSGLVFTATLWYMF